MPVPEPNNIAVMIAESRGEDGAEQLFKARGQLRKAGYPTCMCIVNTYNGYSYLLIDCEINDVAEKVNDARAKVAWLWD